MWEHSNRHMDIRFYIDPETGVPHIYNHDIDEDEIAEVLRNPGEDRSGRGGARVAIGQTRSGRYLRVIYVPDPQPDTRHLSKISIYLA